MTYFYTTKEFPKMKILEDNYENIKKEIPNFVFENVKIKRKREEWGKEGENLFTALQNNKEWILSWQAEDSWFSFPLMYNNRVFGLAEEMCPNTIKILKSLGNIKTSGFSLLYPKSSLDIHTDDVGPSFNSMALNMSLTGTNSNLSIYEDNKKYIYYHENGKAVIFNSEYYHNASNNGDINRVILYIDFEIDSCLLHHSK